MNRDDVIRMAREAGMLPVHFNRTSFDTELSTYTPELERFAALVAAAEREECAAQMMQEHENYRRAADSSDDHDHIDWCQTAALVYSRAAATIRARTN